MARIQKVSLDDFEAGVLMGFIGEWLDNSKLDGYTRDVLDSIYQKIDHMDEIEED